MSKLRFLEVRSKVHLPGGLGFLPNSIRYLRWDCYPLEYLPVNFHLDELVELDLSRSKLKQLVLVKPCRNLKRIILRLCCDLISVSDLANAPNLEIIDVTGCSKLVELGPSIGNLSKLTGLYLRWCSSLKTISGFPSSIKDLDLTSTGISQLPSTIEHLAHLKHLSLESCSSLLSLPESLCRMENLEHLDLKHCSKLASLPNTFSSLKNLRKLDLSHCKNLRNLPERFGKLKSLVELDMCGSGIKELPSSIELLHLECISLNHCLLLDFPQQVCSIKSLQVLNIQGNNFTHIRAKLRDLSNLRRLDLSNCEYLLSLPVLPPSLKLLYARNCKSLELIPVPFTFPQVFMDLSNCHKLDHMAPAIMEQYLFKMDVGAFEVPELSVTGNEVPKWMKYQNNNGSSLTLELESSGHSINVVFCAVVAPKASVSLFSNNRAQVQALLSDDNGIISCYNAYGIVDVSESQSGFNVVLWRGKIQCGRHVIKASFVCKWLGDDENGHVSRCDERNGAIIKCGLHPVIEGEDQGSSRLHLLSRF